MDYQPEQLIITRETPPPPVAPPPEVEAPPVPDTGNLAKDKEIECPAPNQPRVGDLTQNGEERVTGHEIQNGQCVVLYESTTTIEKYLPSTNQISTTAAIAVVATASAAATPLLLRVIKPIIKKATDTIRKKLGKGKKKEEQTPEQIAKKYKMKKLVIWSLLSLCISTQPGISTIGKPICRVTGGSLLGMKGIPYIQSLCLT